MDHANRVRSDKLIDHRALGAFGHLGVTICATIPKKKNPLIMPGEGRIGGVCRVTEER